MQHGTQGLLYAVSETEESLLSETSATSVKFREFSLPLSHNCFTAYIPSQTINQIFLVMEIKRKPLLQVSNGVYKIKKMPNSWTHFLFCKQVFTHAILKGWVFWSFLSYSFPERIAQSISTVTKQKEGAF